MVKASSHGQTAANTMAPGPMANNMAKDTILLPQAKKSEESGKKACASAG